VVMLVVTPVVAVVEPDPHRYDLQIRFTPSAECPS